MHISEASRAANREMHETKALYGTSGSQWRDYVLETIAEEKFATVLDFGCGKGLLASDLAAHGITVAEYDPAIPGKDQRPEPAELVICTDVFEHVEPEHLDGFFRELDRVTTRKLIWDVSLIESMKHMPDGSNAHRIIKPADWWVEQLSRYFDVTYIVSRPEFTFACGEAVPRGMGQAESDRKAACGKRRRKITPELADLFSSIRASQAKCADAFSRIDTIRLYEGVGDEMADMQVVMDWLDDEADPEARLREALSMSRKALMVRASVTADRTEQWWKDLFDRYTRMIEWQCNGNIVVAICAPKVGVQGFVVVGALGTDERWTHVEASVKRIAKRIEPQPAHDRLAVLACYGPSLKGTLQKLKDEAEGGDVISVSGAHDFLIENRVVPAYHVECDPRPHKALNIAKGNPWTQYLIGSCCHPDVFDRLDGCDVSLWHVGTPEHFRRFATEMNEDPRLVIPGGGSVGLRSIPLLYSLGYRRFSIHGMDCSFANADEQWAGKHAGKKHDVVTVRVGAREFVTSPQLLSYATDFVEMIQKVSDCSFAVYGDHLLSAFLAALSSQSAAA